MVVRWVLALLAACLLLAGSPAAFAAPGEGLEPVGTKGRVAGFGVTTSDGGFRAVTEEAARIASTGSNTVMLEATWLIDSQRATYLHRGPLTVTDADLLAAAEQARAAGLSVMLTTKIVCQGCGGDQANTARWRGALEPFDRGEFFDSYRQMSNHYADLAEQMGATVYFAGSEMNTLQGETDEWRRVLLESRERFRGKIGYQVNWNALSAVDFWDDVDVAGVSAYFPLSDAEHPSVEELVGAWSSSTAAAWRERDWLAELEDFAASHGKPVLFGEVGYQSAGQAARRPFVQERTERYDAALQAHAYEAVLRTFQDRPWWLGVLWWEWKLTGGGRGDLDFTPRGKPAEALLGSWYTEPGLAPPSMLAALPTQTVEQVQARAAARTEFARVTQAAAALAALLLLAHGLLLRRLLHPPDIFPH